MAAYTLQAMYPDPVRYFPRFHRRFPPAPALSQPPPMPLRRRHPAHNGQCHCLRRGRAQARGDSRCLTGRFNSPSNFEAVYRFLERGHIYRDKLLKKIHCIVYTACNPTLFVCSFCTRSKYESSRTFETVHQSALARTPRACGARRRKHESSRTFAHKRSHKRGSRGRQPPGGVCGSPTPGVPKNPFSFFCAPPQAARGRKEILRGHPASPVKGWPPLTIPLLKRIERHRTFVRKIRDDSWEETASRSRRGVRARAV